MPPPFPSGVPPLPDLTDTTALGDAEPCSSDGALPKQRSAEETRPEALGRGHGATFGPVVPSVRGAAFPQPPA